MTEEELNRVCDALENDRDNISWGDGSLYAGSGQQEFTWDGTKYQMHEYFEIVTQLYVVKYW